jgi:hypothetical protein
LVWIQSAVLAMALGGAAPKSKSHTDLDRNSSDWAWTRCIVLSGDIGGTAPIKVQVDDASSEMNGAVGEMVVAAASIQMANTWDAGAPPADLITLTHLHEPSVVYCLRRRYEQDVIYTSTGPILIALNPFKALPGLYEDDQMSDYWAFGEGLNVEPLPPHVYGNADKAFRKMMLGIEAKLMGEGEGEGHQVSCDQSMLVSGESGAGKTVTTKHIMKYLATLSQRKADHVKRRRAPSPGRGENNAPRREQSMRNVSRAQSWKAGAQIEEKSKCHACLHEKCFLAKYVSAPVSNCCIYAFLSPILHFQFSSPTLSWKHLVTPALFVTTIPLALENSLNFNSSKPARSSGPPLIPTFWKKCVSYIKMPASATFTSFMKCWRR